ncbi:cryptochrome/photolyase family protein [Microbulbifer sp. HZ11]|uniref:cryptochrome/photolyase family protein n=1 Tax=Microbulbifer sp. HZ11 TaxID=1453501 RepID=UPI00068F054D|nr:cryptochrome/photolyase family protein [Microbulbifer sp. HZ11]
MRQETDYVKHHIQKVVAFFEAMAEFAQWLEDRGKNVIYYTLDTPENTQKLGSNIARLVSEHQFERFQYQLPDEYRLDQQLKLLTDDLSIPSEPFDSEHFLTDRQSLSRFFDSKKSLLMESFYRHMRKQHQILLNKDGSPVGGQWNYDQNNRNKWKGEPKIPPQRGFRKQVVETLKRIERAGVNTFGAISPEQFNLPTTRTDALAMLRHFCEVLLPHFGTKPYISSGSYIHKVSNYCDACRYKVQERTSDDACPCPADHSRPGCVLGGTFLSPPNFLSPPKIQAQLPETGSTADGDMLPGGRCGE